MASGGEKKITSDPVVGQPCWECENKCRGGYMPYNWRKKCQTCGCARHCHQDFSHYAELQSMHTHEDILSLADKKKLDSQYSWYPKGVEYNIVEKYMSSLPKDFIPYKSSKQRLRMLHSQHPLQDKNVLYCHNLPDIERKRMIKLIERRMRKYFGLGKVSLNDTEKVCSECSTKIKEGSVIVTAEDRVTAEKMWHPECFRCHCCAELLVDLMFFYSPEKDEIYCGRHHAETIVQRCCGCDEEVPPNKKALKRKYKKN